VKVHLIAIGGSAMHNLAIALSLKGFEVTGSDDEIVEPSRSRLEKYGLLPATIGWDESRIHNSIDAIILGMHARQDNPELLRAQELGLRIYSYPEYLFEQTRNKQRIVIGGSHGKTTITAMVLHVLHHCQKNTDYMVGAQLTGFDCMVRLSEDAPVAVLEGDEYLSSPIDRRPKFHLYRPHVALISGIAWDHINVFPTFENYVEQFSIFLDQVKPGGTVVYCENDPEVRRLVERHTGKYKKQPYGTHEHTIEEGVTYLTTAQGKVPLLIFGEHNLQNLNGARYVCQQAGISDEQFYDAIRSFKGAARRMELVDKNSSTAMYKDFAHSPSKLKATTMALKQQFPHRRLVACMELHTFSSLNESFLEHYHESMSAADVAMVYFNPHTIAHKKLKPVTEEQVAWAFGGAQLQVFTDTTALKNTLLSMPWSNSNLLLMTSGTFDGMDFAALASQVLMQ
jgi:UDP-N-acetylmuramate: L-alanyl-gamma-D-glutamyl-meso-diaminopimelate ligase